MTEDARISTEQQLENLDEFESKNADLIVEVAHPDISRTHGTRFMSNANYFVGSPTCLANVETEAVLMKEADRYFRPYSRSCGVKLFDFYRPTGFGLHVPVSKNVCFVLFRFCILVKLTFDRQVRYGGQ